MTWILGRTHCGGLFFPLKQAELMKTKSNVCVSLWSATLIFSDVFFKHTQKNKWFKAPYLLWFGQSIHALHLQTPSVCFTQTPSLISAALQFLAFGTVVRAFLHRITPKSHLHCAHRCLFTVDLAHGYEIFPKHGILRVPAHQIT